MRITLLVGLFAGLSWAADINIWEVDSNCDQHRAALEKSYNDAAAMASKALQDLQTIQSPRPRYTRANVARIQEWDRVARAVTNMFGFVPDKAGHPRTETHLANVLCKYLWSIPSRTLISSYNHKPGVVMSSFGLPFCRCLRANEPSPPRHPERARKGLLGPPRKVPHNVW